MSKHETWRTRHYWQKVGGLLIEEFLAVKGTKDQGKRLIDGLIVLGEEKGIHPENHFNIKGRDVVVIQTKASRIGMYLMGQAYFSKKIIEMHHPKSVKTIAICGKNDIVMQDLANAHDVEIVVIHEADKMSND